MTSFIGSPFFFVSLLPTPSSLAITFVVYTCGYSAGRIACRYNGFTFIEGNIRTKTTHVWHSLEVGVYHPDTRTMLPIYTLRRDGPAAAI